MKRVHERMLDGTLGDSEEVVKRLLDCSEEVALVKRLTLCEECKGYPQSGFRNDLPFSRDFTACFFHLGFMQQWGASSQFE